VKTRWERYCELRAIDNWCLQHPRKSNLVALGAGLVIFGISQLLQILPPEFLLALIFAAFLYAMFAGGRE
jgi:hypothetical protein